MEARIGRPYLLGHRRARYRDQNPVTDRKLRLLDDYCDLRDGPGVLDIGCGKAWVLRQWADRYAIQGTGIDINPRFIEVARRKAPLKGKLTFHTRSMSGFEYAELYDIVMCLGATQAIGDIPSTVDWMVNAAKPGGYIVLGCIRARAWCTVPRTRSCRSMSRR